MRKSVGSKRNQLSEENITEIAKLYGEFAETDRSKIFTNEDFFYRTITVERPLRLNYSFAADRVERALALRSVRRLDDDDQAALRDAFSSAAATWEKNGGIVSTSRADFTKQLHCVIDNADVKLTPAVTRGILSELGEHDDDGELVQSGGKIQPNPDLRDTENVPWHEDVYDYLEREVKPFVPDAWIDESKTREGAEIPFTRHFYQYTPPRPLEEIDRDLDEVLGRIRARLERVKA